MSQPRKSEQRAPRAASQRAAFFARIVGVVQIAVFGSCAFGLTSLGRMDPNDLNRQVLSGQLTPQQAEQAMRWQEDAGLLTIGTVMVGVVPGVIYLGASGLVRRGRPAATLAVMMLAGMQVIAVGLWCLDVMVDAVRVSSPVAVTFTVVTLGTLAALLGATILWCWRASSAMSADASADSDVLTDH